MSTPAQQLPGRYCNVTFVRDGSLGENGEAIKLKACSRCRDTFYVSRQAQQSHWKVHRKVCQSPDDFADLKRRIAGYSVEEATDHLRDVLMQQASGNRYTPESPRAGYSYLWVLQRLDQLARQGNNPRYMSIRHLLPDEPHGSHFALLQDEQIESLWAVPGMTAYLLNLDLVFDSTLKQLKPPTPRYLAKAKRVGFHPKYQLTADFCNLVGMILFASSCTLDFRSLFKPGALRQTAIATVASRKIMQWLQCPKTFMCIPNLQDREMITDAKFRALLDLLLRKTPGDPDEPSALAPGLTVEGAMRVLLYDIVSDRELAPEPMQELIGFLFESMKTHPHAWRAFSVDSRAELAIFIHREILCERHLEIESDMKELCRHMRDFVCGYLIDPSLWLKCVIACREKYGPSKRSFFQTRLDHEIDKSVRPSVKEFLRLSKASVPDEVETLICEFAFGTQCTWALPSD